MGYNQYTRSNLVVLILFSFATCTTLTRLYTRARLLQQVGADDLLVLFATILQLALIPLHYTMVTLFNKVITLGTGVNQSSSDLATILATFDKALKMEFINVLFYLSQFGLIKLSILAFYRRFLPRKYHLSIYIVAACTAAYTLAACLISVLQCTPISDAWKPPAVANCHIDKVRFHRAIGFVNLITDFLILLMPIPTVMALQVDRKKKCVLVLVFSVGVVTTIATALRLRSIFKLGQLTKIPSWPELIFLICSSSMWSQVELTTATICANFPTIAAIGKAAKNHRRRSMVVSEIYGARNSVLIQHSDGDEDKSSESKSGDEISSPVELDGAQASPGILRSTTIVVDVETSEAP